MRSFDSSSNFKSIERSLWQHNTQTKWPNSDANDALHFLIGWDQNFSRILALFQWIRRAAFFSMRADWKKFIRKLSMSSQFQPVRNSQRYERTWVLTTNRSAQTFAITEARIKISPKSQHLILTQKVICHVTSSLHFWQDVSPRSPHSYFFTTLLRNTGSVSWTQISNQEGLARTDALSVVRMANDLSSCFGGSTRSQSPKEVEVRALTTAFWKQPYHLTRGRLGYWQGSHTPRNVWIFRQQSMKAWQRSLVRVAHSNLLQTTTQ